MSNRLWIHTTVLAALALANFISPVAARGGLPTDDPWSPKHIEALPAEIRSVLARLCRGPMKAQHYFATYAQDSAVIILHFEYLHCGERGLICASDKCLHQVYQLSGGHYRLWKSFYSPRYD
jgi:hypothetical protein